MNQSCCQKRIWLGLVSVLVINSAIATTTNSAIAQITPDNTLGSESSNTQSVLQRPLEVIDGGAIRGSNLFHSFSEFNVAEGRGAYFFSPSADIQNILTRVTGGNPSIILGTIGTYGNSVPNLFLINPNGIIFGPSATLDIGNTGGLNNIGGTGGSFVATTADTVLLGNNGIFSASNPAASNLLTVNPSALFFNGTSTAGIVNRSFGLIVPYGRSLLLVGDNVRLDNAGLAALDGRIELGAVAAGTVGLNVDGNNLSLNYLTQVQRADVVVTNNSLISVAGRSGGNIAINARNIDILDQSTLLGGSSPLVFPIGVAPPPVGSSDTQVGDITLNATGAIAIAGKDNSFASSSTIFNNLNSGGVEQGGSINITADSLSLNGAGITTINNGQGNAGSIFIQAKNLAAFVDSEISSRLTEEASGKAGNIDIQAQSIFFNSTGLNTGTSGRGDAGDVFIRAGLLSLENKSTLSTTVLPGGVGKGGNINIQARSFSLTDESNLNTITAGRGDAGSVFIQATDFVSLVYSDIFTSNIGNLVGGEVAVGNSGNIQILTGSLFLENNSTLNTITSGFGDAGNISIRTSGSTSLTGSNIVSSVFNSALSGVVGANVVGQGKSGDISIEADSLKLDNTTLITSTAGKGDAGAISVKANNISLTSNSQINSAVGQGGVGDAGDIELNTRSLLVTGGSQIRASVGRPNNNIPGGQGAGGNIRINASDDVEISGVSTNNGASSALSTSTNRGASGQAGSITVNTTNFRIADGAVVSALTANSSNAGNITINANNFEAIGGGQVLTSTSSSGRAGSITLNVTDKIALNGTDPNFATRLAQFGEDTVTNQSSASGLFANTAPGSTGDGGSIFIDPIEFNITGGAGVSVSSQGQGNAGNLEVRAGTITLDKGGFLSANTASGEGGNIDIRAQDLLLLRRNSNISTAAGGSGNGGNINLDAALLVAQPQEDSNIIADAIEGRGGNINITTEGIFGIQSRPEQTAQSDITASSQLGIDGTVDQNTPDVDPAQGLVALPVDTVDATKQIASGCTNSNNSASSNKFNVTGRGGLPPNPGDNLSNDAVLTDWATLAESSNNSNSSLSSQKSPAQPIVEAQGWVIDSQGKVILTAQAPTVTPNSNQFSLSSCRSS